MIRPRDENGRHRSTLLGGRLVGRIKLSTLELDRDELATSIRNATAKVSNMISILL
jgi:hypothetical protein